jgi:spectinomycin phosphotransferase
MHEPPAYFDPIALSTALYEAYGISPSLITFLPLGHDSSAWVYAAETDTGARYFLKLRTSVSNPLSLSVPRYLRDQGIPAVAPLPTLTGALWTHVAPYELIVYPFIAGASAMHQGMDTAQWRAYGAILRRIHDLPLPAGLTGQVRRETFEPVGAAAIRTLDAHLTTIASPDPLTRRLAAFWAGRREQIHVLAAQGEALGHQLAAQAPPFVLCHADIHTNNLLVEPTGTLWLVDWDETMLAPRERDLMFVIGGISARFINPQQEAWCREGYGLADVNLLALAYYRYAWALSDIGDFAAQVVFRPDLGPVSREAALQACIGLFAPGEIVDIAGRSPTAAPFPHS